MHDMYLRGKVDLSGTRASRLGATTGLAFIIDSVIDVKVIKTNASFLTVYWGTCLYNSFCSYNEST